MSKTVLTSFAKPLLVLLALLPAAAAADGGYVTAASGNVQLKRGAAVAPLAIGAPVQTGDRIETAANGSAQIWMEDDSTFRLGQSTDFRIDEFAVGSPMGGAGAAVYSMLKGSLRTITGLIGKRSSDRYELRTPIATMGVRGTDYAALLCLTACTVAGRQYAAGIYLSVYDGTATMTKGGTTLVVRAGQNAFSAPDGTPLLIQDTPLASMTFETGTGFGTELDFDAAPPRIEREPPASPSAP